MNTTEDLERVVTAALKVNADAQADDQRRRDEEKKERKKWREFLDQLPRQSKETYLQRKMREEEERINKKGRMVEDSPERVQKKMEEDFHWQVMTEPDHHQTRKTRRAERHSADLIRDLTGEDTFEFELSSSQDSK